MKFQLIKRFAPFVLAGIASVGNAQDVSAIIEGVKSQYAPDTRVAVWEISQVSENGMLMLSGKVDDAKAKEALLAELKKMACNFRKTSQCFRMAAWRSHGHWLIYLSLVFAERQEAVRN